MCARRDSNPQPSDPKTADQLAEVTPFPTDRRPKTRRLEQVSQSPVSPMRDDAADWQDKFRELAAERARVMGR